MLGGVFGYCAISEKRVADKQFQTKLNNIEEGQKALRKDYVELAANNPIVSSNISKIQTYSTSMAGGAVGGGSFALKTEHIRIIDEEKLRLALKGIQSSSAAIQSDIANREAHDFANQLEAALRIEGWIVSGNSFADSEYFSDSLAIEVSADPASSADHSSEEAKSLLDILQTEFNIKGVLYHIDRKFPSNFMLIKVGRNR